MLVAAALSIIDLIAIANVEALLGAISPDRKLNEPGEGPWKATIELPRVDPLGDRFDDVGAAAWPVTREAIEVVGTEPAQDTGSVQKIMNQRVNGDHAGTDLNPAAAISWRAEQEHGQGHAEHLVGDP